MHSVIIIQICKYKDRGFTGHRENAEKCAQWWAWLGEQMADQPSVWRRHNHRKEVRPREGMFYLRQQPVNFLLVTSGIFLAHKTTKKRKSVKKKRKENKRQERPGEEKARKKRKGKERKRKQNPGPAFLGNSWNNWTAAQSLPCSSTISFPSYCLMVMLSSQYVQQFLYDWTLGLP